MSMPYRIQKIEEFVKQLETGDLKLRVRVLEVNTCFFAKFDHFINFFNHIRTYIYNLQVLKDEKCVCIFQSERAARKANILQMATMYTVFGGTLLNIGVALNSQGSQIMANGTFIGAGKTTFCINNSSFLSIKMK